MLVIQFVKDKSYANDTTTFSDTLLGNQKMNVRESYKTSGEGCLVLGIYLTHDPLELTGIYRHGFE